jgi:hypothetical protein
MSHYHRHKPAFRESGQASPFAILVAALLGILVLALLCTGGALVIRERGQADDIGATSTAIAIANATTLAQNARVTQTIAAIETEAARPTSTSTSTPTPTNTATATATATLEPTATAVAAEPEGEETPTPNFFVTSIFEGTPTGATAAAPSTGGTGAGTGTGTGGGTLPQTGGGLGALIIGAVLLTLSLGVVRRLRSG